MKKRGITNSEYAPILVRWGIALVFLWFGINQIINPDMFLGWMHVNMQFVQENEIVLIMIHGVGELILGTLLILGLWTRVVATLLAINLLGITVNLGYNDIAVRDVGLLLATVAIMMHGPDRWCLDSKKKD